MSKISYALTAALILPLFLSGCAGGHKLKVVDVAIQRPHLNLPTPDQVLANPIHWMAIAKGAPAGQKGSIEHFWAQMEAKGYTTGLALSPGEYKALTQNNAKMRKFILQQQAIIKAYKRYYEENK